MNQQRPQGRRRALDDGDASGTDPASFTDLAAMWRSISGAHGVLDHQRRHFQNTEADDGLAELLSLVPILHDAHPVTENESRELAYLLGLYAEPPAEATRDEVARAASAAIRRLATRRRDPGPSD